MVNILAVYMLMVWKEKRRLMILRFGSYPEEKRRISIIKMGTDLKKNSLGLFRD
jgi:hypothetical protein